MTPDPSVPVEGGTPLFSERYLEAIDRIDRVILEAGDLETLSNGVLAAVLSLLECDRAFLVYPCDPEAPSWRVPYEVTRPEWPGAISEGAVIPMSQSMSGKLQALLAAKGPLSFGDKGEYPIPESIKERYQIKSMMSVAIRPEVGNAWEFGIHQCGRERLWSEADRRLFHEAGKRLAMALRLHLSLNKLKENERILSDSLTEYKTLFDNLPGQTAKLRYLPNGLKQFLFVSSGAASDLAPIDWVSLSPEEVADIFADNFDLLYVALPDTLRKMGYCNLRFSMTEPSGRTKWLEIRENVTEHLADGGMITQAIIWDVTEEEIAKQALSDKEKRLAAALSDYESLIDNLPGRLLRLHYLPDDSKKVLYASSGRGGASQPLPLTEMSPKEFGEMFKEDYDLLYVDVPKRLRETGKSEHRFRRHNPDGSILWLHVRESVVEHLEDGGMIVEALTWDVTAEENAKLALQKSEARFKDLLQALPVGVFAIDNDDNTIFYNEAAVNIWGRRPDLGKSHRLNSSWKSPDGSSQNIDNENPIDWVLSVDGNPFPLDERPIMQAKKKNEALRDCETVMRRPDGSQVPLLTYPSPLHNHDGDAIGAFNVYVDISAQKKLEAELRETASYLQNLVDNIPGTIARLHYSPDNRKTITFVAGKGVEPERARNLCSLSADDLPGLYAPEDRYRLFHEVPTRLRSTGHSEQRYRIPGKDGKWIWMQAHERVVEYRSDGSMIADAISIDVTEEVESKLALERSELRFKELLQALPVGVFAIDHDGNNKFYNEAFVNLVGRRPVLARPNNLASSWGVTESPPRSQDDNCINDWILDKNGAPLPLDKRPMMIACRENRPINGFEMMLRRPDGELISVLSHTAPLHASNGEVTGAFNVIVDISAMKKLEAELRSASNRYRKVLDTIPNLIVRYNKDLHRIYVNRAWEKLSGLKADEVLLSSNAGAGKDPAPIIPAYFEKLTQAFDTGMPQQAFFNWTNAYGIDLRLNYTIIPEFAEDGEVTSVLAVGLDETERWHAEQERKHLDQRIQETRKLEALGQLAGGIAHDFNNLLGAILGFAKFIEEDADPDKPTAHHAERIIIAGKRGKALVQQILAFSRKNVPSRSCFLLNKLVLEMIELLSTVLPSTTHIHFDPKSIDLEVEADRDQIGQVLMNLVVNASDALHGNPGMVTLSVSPANLDRPHLTRLKMNSPLRGIDSWSDDEGNSYAVLGSVEAGRNYLSLSIEDDGIGIDQDTLPNIFTPFFTTKDKARGTGLGLAVVFGIVLSHEGALTVETKTGTGTRFEILLPCTGLKSSTSQGSMRIALPKQLSHRLRILLVDDDPDFGDMLQIAFERRGFEVAYCAGPNDALAALSDSPDYWDVLITDQTMPSMLGTNLIKEALRIRPSLPCILCTGNVDGLDEAKLDETGVRALVHKPFLIEDIIGVLTKALIHN
jgi:PAS domain S-box-containing protein